MKVMNGIYVKIEETGWESLSDAEVRKYLRHARWRRTRLQKHLEDGQLWLDGNMDRPLSDLERLQLRFGMDQLEARIEMWNRNEADCLWELHDRSCPGCR